ncbi:hypothetical protein M434DRAFT_88032 [Hypoxylon sp. CO27-5]|nr:hypothetical protein M434DRAFT_88032 [Hypoxylon sp. CO27-5]
MTISKAVEALQKAFQSEQLALPGTEEYEKLNKSYYSFLQSDISPAAIFLPKSKEQVSQFLEIFKPFIVNGVAQFAVRGAGQQPLPGCSNISNGVTVDLRLLTGLELKKDRIEIGAGERWGAAYEKLTQEGLGVTGGRSSEGGIGGLALAGRGLSFFSSREGFICDNVVNFEVVLATGQVINANVREHPDLWRALRGGGNNFGIVTRYDFRTFEQGPFWGGSIFYFPPSFLGQIEALVGELKKADASAETHFMISIGYSAAFAQFGGELCMNQLYYTRAVEKPLVLEPFASVQPQIDQLNSMRTLTLKEAAEEQGKQSADGVRCAYINTTVKADVPTLKAASDTYIAAIGPLKTLEGIICSLTLQPYSVSLLDKCDNSLGMDTSDGPLVSILLLTWWKNQDDDETIIQTFKGVLEKIDADATSRGTAVPFKYLNYAYSFQDPIRSYGVKNGEKLREVSRKYDPEGIFQKGVPGGFKLF